jgi:outer membrane autotransporter protein
MTFFCRMLLSGASALALALLMPGAARAQDVRREASAYAALPAMAQIYGRALIGTLHNRLGAQDETRSDPDMDDLIRFWRDASGNPEHFAHLRSGSRARNSRRPGGAWGRFVASAGEHDGGESVFDPEGPEFEFDLFALQAGMTVYGRKYNDSSRDRAGVTIAVGRIEGDVFHFDDARAGEGAIEAMSLGGYWTRFFPQGAYLDGVVQVTWYDAKAQSHFVPAIKADATGSAISLEGGHPFAMTGADRIIEPQAQLVYQHFDSNEASNGAVRVAFDDIDSLLGRLGARAAKTWTGETTLNQPRDTTGWARLNVWHEFLDPPETRLLLEDGPVPFTADLGETWIEAGAGLTMQAANTTALYADASYSWDVDNGGRALAGRVGARFNW